MEFKVGDKVMPVGDCRLTAANKGWSEPMTSILYTTCTVTNGSDDYYVVVKSKKLDTRRVTFAHKDVIRIKERDEVYELTSSFRGADLLGTSPCIDGFNEFVQIYGFYNAIHKNNFDDFIDFALTRKTWVGFLCDNGFIEILEPLYDIGDLFEINDRYYMLSETDAHKVTLISVTKSRSFIRGSRWGSPIPVKDASAGVTVREFQTIAGIQWKEFKHVPEKQLVIK